MYQNIRELERENAVRGVKICCSATENEYKGVLAMFTGHSTTEESITSSSCPVSVTLSAVKIQHTRDMTKCS